MTKRIAKWTLAAVLLLPVVAPALAQQPDWSQRGDYYAPERTIVQRATPRELNKFRDGDYYAPTNTIVQQATPHQFKKFREGDYYAPGSGQ